MNPLRFPSTGDKPLGMDSFKFAAKLPPILKFATFLYSASFCKTILLAHQRQITKPERRKNEMKY